MAPCVSARGGMPLSRRQFVSVDTLAVRFDTFLYAARYAMIMGVIR